MDIPVQFERFAISDSIYDLPRVTTFDEARDEDVLFPVTSRQKMSIIPPAFMFTSPEFQNIKGTAVFQQQFRNTAEIAIARINNAYVLGGKFFVFNSRKVVIKESLPVHVRWNPDAAKEQLIVNELPIRKLSGAHVALGVHNHNNYFHWHIDVLSSAIVALQHIDKNTHFLTPPLRPWQRRSLNLIGVEDARIVETTDEIYKVETLIFPSNLSRHGFEMTWPVKALFEKITNNLRISPLIAHRMPKKVYLSRTDVSFRSCANEADFMNYLEKKGFLCFTPGSLTYDQQAIIMSNAETVVGLHGAGLTNTGYSPPHSQLIEVMPSSFMNAGYFAISQVFERKYSVFAIGGGGTMDRFQHPSQWTVDIDAFDAQVTKII
ncbi:glycosyltransferase family 61 protein [Roseomonas gilardii]|uniref:glycosyltransferase family 61 protein n=1 Tax=Roseomonas gilardii TaxID=257708 RepID=UPI000952E07D|nr:glycosyltransferase family 61 protein [Roseomonas gilardii]